MHKSRLEYRDGYKAHLAIEPETGLATAAALTPATVPATGRPVSCCWPTRNPGSRSWATAPMARARHSPHWVSPDINRPSSRGRLLPAVPVASTRGLRRGRVGSDRHLPGRPHRLDHVTPSGRIRCALSGMSTPSTAHHLPDRPDPSAPSS